MADFRFGLAVLALAASACSSQPAAAPVDEENLVECALGGAETFTRECAVERSLEGDTLYLTVRQPDGGFRRFEVMQDGTGLATADGADAAKVSLSDGGIEVVVGPDRYRFPAKVTGGAGNDSADDVADDQGT